MDSGWGFQAITHPTNPARLPSNPIPQHSITPAFQDKCLWPSLMALTWFRGPGFYSGIKMSLKVVKK
jgi:hypothetical protein